jgi:hypothetical protein
VVSLRCQLARAVLQHVAMRKSLAVIAILAAGGCATKSSQRVGYFAGGTLAVVGVVATVASLMRECPEDHYGVGCAVGSAMGAGLGITTTLVGGVVLGVSATSDPPPDPEPPPPYCQRPENLAACAQLAQDSPNIGGARVPGPPVPEPPTTDPQLARLTKQASIAARREQCAAVVAVARRVEEIDRDYRARGFVADPVIASCLER